MIWKWSYWIFYLPKDDKQKIKKNFFSTKTFWAGIEVIFESLLHHKIFKKNIFLGYMHMSLAFGWLLLIIVGNLETKVYTSAFVNPPYFPIFFQFFNHEVAEAYLYKKYFSFFMDLLLLFVLSGLAFVFFKRAKSRVLGMSKTTRHRPKDRIAMIALWSIFPLRLFAEGVTAGIHGNGNFLTGSLGQFLVDINFPLRELYMPFWWAYSISLGLFFVFLPFSRFMHITTEILLILLRRWGIREKKKHTTYSQVEINACSRCGICIDICQLSSNLHISNTQPTYFLTSMRNGKPNQKIVDTCMMCMRCLKACPVGIEITNIRENQRKVNQIFKGVPLSDHSPYNVKPAKVAFFAGCMGHLTPSVIKATLRLLKEAEVDYTFIDEDGSICCGKPLKINGEENAAEKLISENYHRICQSGAEALVTTCPICAKIFKDDYDLNIPVYHHTQYLSRLVEQGKLHFRKTNEKYAYHDPCELGRGLGVYNEPRKLLSLTVDIVENKQIMNDSLCCGGSLGITNISAQQRKIIAGITLSEITNQKTVNAATACPLCKKTFQTVDGIYNVKDISEILIEALTDVSVCTIDNNSKKETEISIM
jgi:Fe-S oxidoreductase